MRTTIKKVLLATMLLSTVLFIGLSPTNLALANGNPSAAEDNAKAEAEAKAKEKEAKEKADQAAKEQAESKGDVGEPPSGPDVNKETVEEPIDIQTPASVTGQKLDGAGTVVDFSTSGSKAFYTITDDDHNVFYLVIDMDKTDHNVYFLSDINKAELEGVSPKGENVPPPTEQLESAKTEAPKESGNGFLIAVMLIAVIGVAAYYFLVMRKKKGQSSEDDEDYEDEMSESYQDDFPVGEQPNNDELEDKERH